MLFQTVCVMCEYSISNLRSSSFLRTAECGVKLFAAQIVDRAQEVHVRARMHAEALAGVERRAEMVLSRLFFSCSLFLLFVLHSSSLNDRVTAAAAGARHAFLCWKTFLTTSQWSVAGLFFFMIRNHLDCHAESLQGSHVRVDAAAILAEELQQATLANSHAKFGKIAKCC